MPAQLLTEYKNIISAFIIVVIASFVRLMFNRDITFAKTISNFFGGVSLGMLLGYLLRENISFGPWKEFLIAGVALLGKELTEGFIKIAPGIVSMVPEFLRIFLTNFLNKKKE